MRRLIPFHEVFSLKVCRESRGDRESTAPGTPIPTPKTLALAAALFPFVAPTMSLPTRGSCSILAFRQPMLTNCQHAENASYLSIRKEGVSRRVYEDRRGKWLVISVSEALHVDSIVVEETCCSDFSPPENWDRQGKKSTPTRPRQDTICFSFQ